jgi:hypothetical protein
VHSGHKNERGDQAHPYSTDLYGFLHSFRDFGMDFEICQSFIAGAVARKPRQGCLLGQKVSDSDRGMETVIFR